MDTFRKISETQITTQEVIDKTIEIGEYISGIKSLNDQIQSLTSQRDAMQAVVDQFQRPRSGWKYRLGL